MNRIQHISLISIIETKHPILMLFLFKIVSLIELFKMRFLLLIQKINKLFVNKLSYDLYTSIVFYVSVSLFLN